MLEKYCPGVNVKAIFNDPEEALSLIQKDPPQLLFLDIEMPMLNGFDFLRQLGDFQFKVIFTTAYDQYAVRAFKFNALDYLLKPIDKDELIETVSKIESRSFPVPERVEAAMHLRNNQVPERIALPVGQELLIVEVSEILYCESDGSYVMVYLQFQTKPILLSKSLREIEELLNNPAFFRCHNSFLINLRHIQKILRSEGGEVIMRNGKSVQIARTKKNDLMGLIAKL